MFFNCILIFLISMVPFVELRGAIVFAAGFQIPLYIAFPICVIGNLLPIPFIFFFARKVLEWGADKKLTGKFFSWCIRKGHSGGEKLKAKAGKGLFWALLLFVGIPLPLTGAWTGTLAASFLEMDFKTSIKAVIAGIFLAGIIMATLSYLGFGMLFGLK